jgi:hypothetical protein
VLGCLPESSSPANQNWNCSAFESDIQRTKL